MAEDGKKDSLVFKQIVVTYGYEFGTLKSLIVTATAVVPL